MEVRSWASREWSRIAVAIYLDSRDRPMFSLVFTQGFKAAIPAMPGVRINQRDNAEFTINGAVFNPDSRLNPDVNFENTFSSRSIDLRLVDRVTKSSRSIPFSALGVR
jgi:hypothetical protein